MISTPSKITTFPHGSSRIAIQIPTPNKPGTVKLNVHLKNDAILSMNQTLEYSFDIFKDSGKKIKDDVSSDSGDEMDSFSDDDDDQTVPDDD